MIYIVIPNWNGKDVLKPCLESLLKQTVEAQIVVVDNGSSDGSVGMLKEKYSEVTLIELGKNHGFAGGVNAGIKYALKQGAGSIALFNNDAVAEPDWLEQLVKQLEAYKELGIVAGKLLQADRETIDSVGECYSDWGLPFPRGRGEKDNGQYDRFEKVTGATGGASLYRAGLLKEIGLFDEDFFAYYEDADISLRTWLAGWQVAYAPEAVAYHQIGATSSKLRGFTDYHSLKNVWFLYLKNMPAGYFWRSFLKHDIARTAWYLGALKRGHWWSATKAAWVSMVRTPRMVGKRMAIQRFRKLSNDEFEKLLYLGLPPSERTLRRLFGKKQ